MQTIIFETNEFYSMHKVIDDNNKVSYNLYIDGILRHNFIDFIKVDDYTIIGLNKSQTSENVYDLIAITISNNDICQTTKTINPISFKYIKKTSTKDNIEEINTEFVNDRGV